jgi:primosomal replication protein N
MGRFNLHLSILVCNRNLLVRSPNTVFVDENTWLQHHSRKATAGFLALAVDPVKY